MLLELTGMVCLLLSNQPVLSQGFRLSGETRLGGISFPGLHRNMQPTCFVCGCAPSLWFRAIPLWRGTHNKLARLSGSSQPSLASSAFCGYIYLGLAKCKSGICEYVFEQLQIEFQISNLVSLPPGRIQSVNGFLIVDLQKTRLRCF